MKTLMVCLLVAVGVSGYRVQRQDDVVVEVEDQPEYQPFPVGSNPPYPASGFRPTQQFLLPHQQPQPSQSDPRSLLFPSFSDSPTTTEDPTTTEMPSTTTDLPSTTSRPTPAKLSAARAPDSEVEEVEATDQQKTSMQDGQGLGQGTGQLGVYYVLLPGGQLQKLQYGQVVRVDDVRRARYAQEYVQQLEGPVYAYNPQAAFLQIVAK